jgi:hypothetical protein
MGGRQWFDLMGKGHGTLTAMTGANGWRPSTRPGGIGEMVYAAADDFVSTESAVQIGIGTGDFTVASWVRCTSISATLSRPILAFGATATVYCGVSSSFFGIRIIGASLNSGAAIAANVWTRAVVVRTAGTVSYFLNGVKTPTDNANVGSVGNNAVFLIGNDSSGRDFIGGLDDVTVCTRAWSPAEVMQDYNLSRQGYPGVLLREGDHA